MRVIEALDLVPEGIDLLGAVFFDLLDAGTLVDELAFLVDGHEQLARFEVIDFLALPRGVGVEDLKILAVIHSLVVDRQIVGDGLAGVAAVEAVKLLEVRCRDLADILADLDLGDDIAVLVLHRDDTVILWLRNLEREKPRYYRDNMKLLLHVISEYGKETVIAALRTCLEKNIYNSLSVQEISGSIHRSKDNMNGMTFQAPTSIPETADCHPEKTDINQYNKFFE